MSESKYDGGEEDERTFALSEPKTAVPLSARNNASSNISLDLHFASAANNANEAKDSSRPQEDRVQEGEILVVFDLPDGSQSDSRFRLGQTVEVLKSFVESEFGIPMQSQVLRFKGKVMMDPLSLLDFPDAVGHREMVVKVEGQLPAGSKK